MAKEDIGENNSSETEENLSVVQYLLLSVMIGTTGERSLDEILA